MRDLWDALPATAQDVALLLGLLAPLVLVGALVLYGQSPWPLSRAILARFRWQAVAFVLLIAVSVGTSLALVSQERALRIASAEAAEPFDLIVGAPGSEITLLLAAVFLQPSDVDLLDGAAWDEVARADGVAFAAPLAFGDSVESYPVVGTTAEFATYLGAVEGRLWQDTFEAIAGAATPFALGQEIEPAHGTGAAAEAHDEVHYTVVGRLAPTGTPWDRAILVPVEAVWSTHGLADGHAEAGRLGPPFDPSRFPGTPAIVVRPSSFPAAYALRSQFQGDGTMAFFPGDVLSRLYVILGDVRQAMSALSLVTQGLVAVSVLLGLVLVTRLVSRQIALLRALGAPARFVLATVWSLAITLLGLGAALGLAFGIGAAAVLAKVVSARTDLLLHPALSWPEFHLVAAFLTLTGLAALLPAALSLKGEVVEGLRG